MTDSRRDQIALVIAVLAAMVSLGALVIGRVDTGVRLGIEADRVVILDVRPNSHADNHGLEPGMLVVRLNDRELVRLPQPIYGDPLPNDEAGTPVLLRIEPSAPTTVQVGPEALFALLAEPLANVSAIRPEALTVDSAIEGWPTVDLYEAGHDRLAGAAFAFLAGLVILATGVWVIGSGRLGPSLDGLAVPLAVATGVPLIVAPLAATMAHAALVAAGALVPLAVIPLAMALITRIPSAYDRRLATYVAVGCAAGALALGVVHPPDLQPGLELGRAGESTFLWSMLSGGIALVPGLAAAGPLHPGGLTEAIASSGRLLRSTELAVAGATPLVAIATNAPPYLFPLGLWLVAIALAGRFTVRPLMRLVRRTQLQRDLVVAATEAERARVAADIHDDALQELTMLVRRLDAAGDPEGAESARGIADRLRAICGDLRLPILDDLGVGPALDWLVLRIERLAGGEVRLERTDGTRPPPDVELAFFRVAQEALANAVKHGSPPIVVRYRTTPSGASLSVDDAGAGIDAVAARGAADHGRFGMLNMSQRAEHIGAILDVRRWPRGGTHVALEWRSP
ncbi:MAG: hypothetical protein H0V74_08265 [Chloroflexi bacterium]|nr:hypothetical protein [Chloroflexota bacterium]